MCLFNLEFSILNSLSTKNLELKFLLIFLKRGIFILNLHH